MSTRPLSPAAGQAKTLFRSPGVGIAIGVDQWLPWSVEKAYLSEVFPILPAVTGACSQTAYRLPARSIASAGKLPPVLTVPGAPRSATGRSTQLRPLGSLTLGTGAPNATGKQRPIAILLKVASSWMTYTCLTAVDSFAGGPPGAAGWPRVVATGLTSSLPMIPSSQLRPRVTLKPGPN